MAAYTDEDRETAILICQIAASSEVAATEAALAIEPNGWGPRFDLALAAISAVALSPWFFHDDSELPSYGHAAAEAECLLRDGWSPGDPVVRLNGGS